MENDPTTQNQELNNQELPISIPDGFVATAEINGGESKTSTWRRIRAKAEEKFPKAA